MSHTRFNFDSKMWVLQLMFEATYYLVAATCAALIYSQKIKRALSTSSPKPSAHPTEGKWPLSKRPNWIQTEVMGADCRWLPSGQYLPGHFGHHFSLLPDSYKGLDGFCFMWYWVAPRAKLSPQTPLIPKREDSGLKRPQASAILSF